MRASAKILVSILIAGAVYCAAAPALQQVLLNQLEKTAEIQITGKNLTPFSLFSIRFQDLIISREDLFFLRTESAVVSFSPFETLFGQIPLTLRASRLNLILKDAVANLVLSGIPLETLNARLEIFAGKGVRIDFLDLRGEGLHLTASGKLLKKGKGNSDLVAHLQVSPDLIGAPLKALSQNLFSKTTPEPDNKRAPMNFNIHLRGDLTDPEIAFNSDLISFNVSEAGVNP